VIYRRLSAQAPKGEEYQEAEESGMASGLARSGRSHMSNMPPSSQGNNTIMAASPVKLGRAEQRIEWGGQRVRKKLLTSVKQSPLAS